MTIEPPAKHFFSALVIGMDKVIAIRWLTLWALLWAATALSACGVVGLALHPSSATSTAETLPLTLVGRIGGPALAVATQGRYAYVGYSFETEEFYNTWQFSQGVRVGDIVWISGQLGM